MVNTLAGQTVVIIGGTSGIGYSVAKNIVETTRATVVVASSNPSRVENAAQKLSELGGGGRAKGWVLDVSDSENIKSAVSEFYEKIGKSYGFYGRRWI